MATAATSHPDRVMRVGQDGELFVTVKSWEWTLHEVLHQFALYGRDDVYVVLGVIRMLWSLTWMESDIDRHDQVRAAAELYRELVDIDRPAPAQRVVGHHFDVLRRSFDGDVVNEFRRNAPSLDYSDESGARGARVALRGARPPQRLVRPVRAVAA